MNDRSKSIAPSPGAPSALRHATACCAAAIRGVALVAASIPAAHAAPEIFEPDLVSTPHDDAHVSFSPDGRQLYFLRDTPDFAHWTMLVSQRDGDRWGVPSVAPWAGTYSDADIYFTPAMDRALFVSTRPRDGEGAARADTDLWMMVRNGDGWSTPRLVPELSSDTDEWFPTMTDDGWLYFGSGRRGSKGGSDLWRAEWNGRAFDAPQNLGEVINTASEEVEPLISRDGRTLIYAARSASRPTQAYDLYVTYACDGAWTKPSLLGGDVNSDRWDFGPRWSPDGAWFYFTSNRSTLRDGPRPLDYATLMAKLAAPGNGLRDVYRVAASELGLDAAPCTE